MEKKNQTNRPKAVCEKLFKAITFGSAFSRIHRISNNEQQTPSSPAKEQHKVPIKFDYTAKPKPTTALNGSTQSRTNGKAPKPSAHVVEPNSKPKPEKSYGGTQHYDERFSAFINQTKERIMSPDQEHEASSKKMVGHGHGHGHGVGKDHHFSNFIDRTKKKIRTTSSLKDRSESFFK